MAEVGYETLSTLSAVRATGYTIAQYFEEIGTNNTVYVYSGNSDTCLLEDLLYGSLFRTIEFRLISDERRVQHPFNSHLLPSLVWENIDFERFEPSDVVLVADNDRKVINHIREYTKNVYSLDYLVSEMAYRAFRVRPLIGLCRTNPSLTVVSFSELKMPKENRSAGEQDIVSNKIRPGDFVSLLKNPERELPGALRDFGYSKEDIARIRFSADHTQVNLEGVIALQDCESQYVNIEGGHRITTDQPVKADRTVYIVGGCRQYGLVSSDDLTTASCLQRMLNESTTGMSFRVENYGMNLYTHEHDIIGIAISLPINEKDILFLPERSAFRAKDVGIMPNWHYVDCSLKRPHDRGELFYDMSHYNQKGERWVAEKFYECFVNTEFFSTSKEFSGSFSDTVVRRRLFGEGRGGGTKNESIYDQKTAFQHQLDEWKKSLSKHKPRIGSIVMNCNPFTFGHKHLIEYAAGDCLWLFIFVVEEDKSEFPFPDRIELVRAGTAHLPNVTVLPSGAFIISNLTFSDYFGKSEFQEKQIDPSFDVEIYAKEIAPKLGISVRYAGQEPLDKITDQYNDTMRSMLPRYDIEFVEIPRREESGSVISASRVRKMIYEGSLEETQNLVPPTTYQYLENRFGNQKKALQE